MLDKIKVYTAQRSRMLKLPAYTSLRASTPGGGEYRVMFSATHRYAYPVKLIRRR